MAGAEECESKFPCYSATDSLWDLGQYFYLFDAQMSPLYNGKVY